VRLDPKNGEAFFLRGRAYESSGKSEQAEKDFAMADQLGHELNPASGTIESPE
jgi:Flp pilus assembly protein TadD